MAPRNRTSVHTQQAPIQLQMNAHKGPVGRDDRNLAIDVLRGFALLGILAANIMLFDVDSFDVVEQSMDDLVIGISGAPFMVFTFVFVMNKMMAVFSMLFGAGVLLVTERIEARGESSLSVHYVRNLLLIGIGVAHSALWFGDILLIYGVSGLFLYPLRCLPAKALIGTGSILWLLVVLVVTDVVVEYFLRAPSMMLIGMGLYRLGAINAQRDAAWYNKVMRRSFSVGLPLCTVALGFIEEQEKLALLINNLGVPFMALGYVCLVMRVCVEGKLQRVQARMAAAGQMALTNYLMQTVLGILLIGILNGVRGERVTAFLIMVVMLAIWAAQLTWSTPWLRTFRFAPFEWAWRSITYRRLQPFRK